MQIVFFNKIELKKIWNLSENLVIEWRVYFFIFVSYIKKTVEVEDWKAWSKFKVLFF